MEPTNDQPDENQPDPTHQEGEEGGAGEAPEAVGSPGLIRRVKTIWANPSYRFVLSFIPYLILISVGYPLLLEHWGGLVQNFIHATADIEFFLFDLFSDRARVDGKMVFFGRFAVQIVDECTGIYEMLIFSAAVAAFPTSIKNRVVGLILGNPMIYLFNIIRIAVLIAVGHYQRSWFDFVHVYFMQATMIVMITSVWLLWITQVVRDRGHAGTHPDH